MALALYRRVMDGTIRQADIERLCAPEYDAAAFIWLLVLLRHGRSFAQAPASSTEVDNSNAEPSKGVPGYVISTEARTVRRLHDNKEADLSSRANLWEIFILAWNAHPDRYSLNDLKRDGTRDAKTRSVHCNNLRDELRPIGLKIHDRAITTI